MELTAQADGSILLEGELSFATVMVMLEKLRALLQTRKQMCLDFTKVDRCDSAGVAVLLTIWQQAKQQNKQLTFINLSPQIKQIIIICGLQKIL